MLLGAIAGFVLVVVLSNTNREDTARLVTLAFLAGVAYEPIVINGLEAIGLSRSDGQALLSAEASTRVSADAVDFEELFTELNEKLEQEDTNRVAGELAAIAASIQTNLQTLSQEERDRILGPLIEELQNRLPRDQEEFVFNILRNASIQIDSYIVIDEADFFYNPLDQIVPARLMTPPPYSDPEPLSLMNADYTLTTRELNVHWIPIEITALDDYVITVINQDIDLVAGLYGAVSLLLILSDDDSAGNLNPEISVRLIPGIYYLRITSYSGSLFGSAELKIRGTAIAAAIELPETVAELQLDSPFSYAVPENPSLEIWLAFTIENPASYAIRPTGDLDLNDLVAELYQLSDDELQLIAEDDDSATDYNPEILIDLESQTYYLKIKDFWGEAVNNFSVLVEADPGMKLN